MNGGSRRVLCPFQYGDDLRHPEDNGVLVLTNKKDRTVSLVDTRTASD